MKLAAILMIIIPVCLNASVVEGQGLKPTLSSLGFISGCWEINEPDKKLLVTEQWMKAEGNAMLGMSRSLRKGKLSGFEFLRIVDRDNEIYYISKPSQNKVETAFRLLRLLESEVTFENLKHDYPQRIIYRLVSENNLDARIEGTQGGKMRSVNFPFKRVVCG